MEIRENFVCDLKTTSPSNVKKEISYQKTKIHNLGNAIFSSKIKVVSFDIFDTLLLRPAEQPVDIFRLIGKVANFPGDFVEMRKLAETEAHKHKNSSVDDTTLEDIYVHFSRLFNSSKEESGRIMQIELDVEHQLLYPRKSIQNIYKRAQEAGKEIIITSDMYLPADFLASVLKKNGYTGFKKLYVSSEEKASKASGKLFNKIIEDFARQGIKARQIIHIGDNWKDDVRNAKKAGIKAKYVPKASKEFNLRFGLSAYSGMNHRKTDNSFLTGMLMNYMFDDPYIGFHKGSCYSANPSNLGATIAPFILSFMLWMLEKSRQDGIEQFIFIYRDGYLPQKLCEIFSPYLKYSIPPIVPMHLSRSVRLPYYAKERNGLFNSLYHISGDEDMLLGEFIERRLFVTNEQEKSNVLKIFLRNGYESKAEPMGPFQRYSYFLNELEPFFKKNAQELIHLCGDYCASVLDTNKKIGVFDIGYRGSVSRFLAKYHNINTVGYSMFAEPPAYCDLAELNVSTLKSYITYGLQTGNSCIWVLNYLMEDIISIQEPGVCGLRRNPDIGVEFIRDKKWKKNDVILKAQNAVLEFSEQFASLFGPYLQHLEFDRHAFFDIIMNLLANPNKHDAKMLRDMAFFDSDFITNETNYYLRWYNQKFSKSLIHFAEAKKEEIKTIIDNLCEKFPMLPVLPITERAYYFLKRIRKGKK